MSRSRTVLARMAAAAMEWQRASPSTSASCSNPISGSGRPSIRMRCGTRRTPSGRAAQRSRAMARRMASAVATRMLSRSISRRRRRADAEGQGALRGSCAASRQPDPRREHLAVAEPADGAGTGRKDDGRGNHWSSQWAAARFIDTDEQPLLGPGRPLPLQRGAHAPSAQPSRFSRIRAALPLSARR